MRLFFLFIDGLGLGTSDASVNPLMSALTPNLRRLLEGRPLILDSAPFHGKVASLLALDACLGVPGLPQSATGQAVLLTGVNIPAAIGEHYGPKPNRAVAAYLQDTLFRRVVEVGGKAALLNAYPERYFQGVHSGKRLYSAIPWAVTNAGLRLFSADDLYAGRALSADLTGQGWRERLGYADAPVISARAAGERLAFLAGRYHFSMFEYWPTDYVGHGQDFSAALSLLETLDDAIGGLANAWDGQGLILVTSDHGNLEDLSSRRHTSNPVPCLLIGPVEARRRFAADLHDLTGIATGIERILFDR